MPEDSEIIDLLFARKEEGLAALNEKYGRVCTALSNNILASSLDAEECVNDAYLQIWNTIPPKRPYCLAAYLYTLVRQCACVRYHKNTAKKRNSQYDLALCELADCIPSGQNVEDEIAAKELSWAINEFLSTLKKEDRILFVRRYWCAQSIAQISKEGGKSAHYLSVRLDRIRKKLKKHLHERGFTL